MENEGPTTGVGEDEAARHVPAEREALGDYDVLASGAAPSGPRWQRGFLRRGGARRQPSPGQPRRTLRAHGGAAPCGVEGRRVPSRARRASGRWSGGSAIGPRARCGGRGWERVPYITGRRANQLFASSLYGRKSRRRLGVVLPGQVLQRRLMVRRLGGLRWGSVRGGRSALQRARQRRDRLRHFTMVRGRTGREGPVPIWRRQRGSPLWFGGGRRGGRMGICRVPHVTEKGRRGLGLGHRTESDPGRVRVRVVGASGLHQRDGAPLEDAAGGDPPSRSDGEAELSRG